VNAEFIALAFVAALNPKLLAVDLLLIENRRPRAMFLCVLLGGLTVGINLEAAPGGVAAKQARCSFSCSSPASSTVHGGSYRPVTCMGGRRWTCGNTEQRTLNPQIRVWKICLTVPDCAPRARRRRVKLSQGLLGGFRDWALPLGRYTPAVALACRWVPGQGLRGRSASVVIALRASLTG